MIHVRQWARNGFPVRVSLAIGMYVAVVFWGSWVGIVLGILAIVLYEVWRSLCNDQYVRLDKIRFRWAPKLKTVDLSMWAPDEEGH